MCFAILNAKLQFAVAHLLAQLWQLNSVILKIEQLPFGESIAQLRFFKNELEA